MASLYDINREIDELLSSDFTQDEEIINNETGEITTLGSKLDQLEIDLKTKLDNIGCYIKNLAVDIDAIKNEEHTLAERRKVKENQLERLKEYLTNNLIQSGYTKFESPRCVLSFRKSEQVLIAEGTELPEAFIQRTVVEKPDKKAIKDALKEGVILEGVMLIENKNLQIK